MSQGKVRLVIFNVEEANHLLPEIRPAIEKLVQSKRALDRLDARAEVLSLAASGAAATNPDAVEHKALLERRGALRADIAKAIESVHRRGVLVKDLDRGLVDFYALSGERLVFLCWRLGEPEIAHWHTLQGGFSTRQPLNSADLE